MLAPKVATQYINNRDNTIDSVSLYTQVELEKALKEGDIFCSDLEYVWKNTKNYIKELPFEIDMDYFDRMNT